MPVAESAGHRVEVVLDDRQSQRAEVQGCSFWQPSSQQPVGLLVGAADICAAGLLRILLLRLQAADRRMEAVRERARNTSSSAPKLCWCDRRRSVISKGRLEDRLRPTVAEADAVDADHRRHQEGVRFASAMAEVLLIVESAAKATYVISLGAAPPKSHDIAGLLADQPETVRRAFHTLAGSAPDLAALHEWRTSNYVADRPELPDEDGCAASAPPL